MSGTLGAVMVGGFLLALCVRLVYLVAYHDSPFFSQLLIDAQWHDEWARAWAGGDWDPGERAFFRAPLYPLWLSGIYRVFGHDVLLARLVQAVVGAGTVAALAGAAWRIGGKAAGWWTAVLAAFYGTLVFFDGELLIPVLLMSLLSWALFLLTGRLRMGTVMVAGLLLGLAVITRPNSLALIPVALFVILRQDGATGLRRPWLSAAVLGVLAVAPALGVTAINHRLEKSPVFVASQGGVNFYAGNHAGATGRTIQVPELSNLRSWRQFVEQTQLVAEAAEGRSLESGEVSSWWGRRGWDWIRNNKPAAFSLTLRKAYYLLNAYEVPNNRNLYTNQPAVLSPLLWFWGWVAFPWGLVFPLAVMGWMVGRASPETRRWSTVLGLWFLAYFLSILPFFVTARFRMGMLIPVLVFAGLALGYVRCLRRPAVLASGILACILVNSAWFDARAQNPAHQNAVLGHVLIREGRVIEGVLALETSQSLDPNNVGQTSMLADGYLRLGRFEEALPLLERVLTARPADPEVRFSLGVVFLAMETYEHASAHLEAAVALDPDHVAAWVNLGVAYQEMRLYEQAEFAYRKGVALAPEEELATERLAELLRILEQQDGRQ